MYPGFENGIDCVFETDPTVNGIEQVFTYTLRDGSGVFLGEGDLHDTNYDEYEESTVMLEEGTMSASSENYSIRCYPNSKFAETYDTNAPKTAAWGAVAIIAFVSALFFVYDRFVRKEFNARKELLEAKRQFVRFVSHEVRTPLNSVGMGLTLMKEEMAQSRGYKSSESMVDASVRRRFGEGGGYGNDSSSLSNASNDGGDPAGDSNSTSSTTAETMTSPDAMFTSVVGANAKEWFTLADEIQGNTQCAVDVLNDLLNYDKIENGSLSLELTVIPIWELIERTVNEFKLPMASKGINLHFSLPEGGNIYGQKVVGDFIRLSQVMRNLISNAIKFTPEGGDITVDAEWVYSSTSSRKLMRKDRTFLLKGNDEISCQSSGKLVLTVKDTGAGMTQDQLKRLFGKGVQFNVNDLQHGNGSGLGLYISKGIVEQHDGQLICTSKGIGMGTSFMMSMPLYDFTDEDKDVECNDECGGFPSEQVGQELAYEDSKLRILIVDDADMNRKLLSRLLAKKGHSSAQAEDGDIAVDMVLKAELTDEPFDLILMDYEMPAMTGPEASKRIRQGGSDVFIIGLTGNLMPEDIEHFQSAGAGAVLGKPFRMSELEDMIVEHNITGSIVVDEMNRSNRYSMP